MLDLRCSSFFGQVELAESETGTGTEMGAEMGTGMDNQMGGAADLISLTFLLWEISSIQQPSLC